MLDQLFIADKTQQSSFKRTLGAICVAKITTWGEELEPRGKRCSKLQSEML